MNIGVSFSCIGPLHNIEGLFRSHLLHMPLFGLFLEDCYRALNPDEPFRVASVHKGGKMKDDNYVFPHESAKLREPMLGKTDKRQWCSLIEHHKSCGQRIGTIFTTCMRYTYF